MKAACFLLPASCFIEAMAMSSCNALAAVVVIYIFSLG